jgi:hypothetical protein
MEATIRVSEPILQAPDHDVGLTNVLAPNLQIGQPRSDVRLLWTDATDPDSRCVDGRYPEQRQKADADV